ncbi:hypothetical protein HG549_08760 [Pseudomonas sp. SK]|nr:hypothetical protein HG549_08760 [Pseudomonas sp. SK]
MSRVKPACFHDAGVVLASRLPRWLCGTCS